MSKSESAKESNERARGYRSTWSPALISSPEDLAEQISLHFDDAATEIATDLDPRMVNFLAGIPGMEPAVGVLRSALSAETKLIHLQHILAPNSPIRFRGYGLDDATFADQIQLASDGDETALAWLEEIRSYQILEAAAAATGSARFAEAGFRLSRWDAQADLLIKEVAVKAKKIDLRVRSFRRSFEMLEKIKARRDKALRKRARSKGEKDYLDSYLDRMNSRLEFFVKYGRREDWFVEETREYLRSKYRQCLPELFAYALTPASKDISFGRILAEEVLSLGDASLTEVSLYLIKSESYDNESLDPTDGLRANRIVQGVERAIEAAKSAKYDDIGTFVVAKAILEYAKSRRDEIAAGGFV